MSPEQETFLLDHLEQSRSQLEAALQNVGSSDWTRQPSPDEWSIGQCAEHIVTVESLVGQRVAQFDDLPIETFDEEDSARKDKLVLMAIDRGTRIKAPARLEPVDKYSSASEMLEDFEKTHNHLAELVATIPEVLRGRFFPHPIFKKLDGYQWILASSCHTMRHVAQIEEVKAKLGLG